MAASFAKFALKFTAIAATGFTFGVAGNVAVVFMRDLKTRFPEETPRITSTKKPNDRSGN